MKKLKYLILAALLPGVFIACKKQVELPQLSKTTLKGVGPTFADIQGRIYVEGSSPITQRGACWQLKTSAGDTKEVQFATINDDTLNVDGGTGFIALRINQLQPDTAYYARFFAINSEGVQYSYPVLVRTPALPAGAVFVEGFIEGTGEGFSMGTYSGAADEGPIHTVVLPNHFIGEKEITNMEYSRFLNALDSAGQLSMDGTVGNLMYIDLEDEDVQIVYNGDKFIAKAGFEQHPVVEVSWYGAKAYCNWYGLRLPTEASWEFAARGGLMSNQFIYAGSDVATAVGWFSENAGGKTHAVGSLIANELGAYDMNGNVWEWCEDWYGADYYAGNFTTDPTGPSSGTTKVLRGGSFMQAAVTTTARYARSPETTESYIGFRVRY